jgi:hypothetical protein
MGNQDVIKGNKYKLAGIDVVQKGTLVDVFAKFAHLDETLDDIIYKPSNTSKPLSSETSIREGSLLSALEKLPPMPRSATMPTLSEEDVLSAIVGPKDIAPPRNSLVELTDKSGVIEDLGPEKLAQVLVKMGEVKKEVLDKGHRTFVPLL